MKVFPRRSAPTLKAILLAVCLTFAAPGSDLLSRAASTGNVAAPVRVGLERSDTPDSRFVTDGSGQTHLYLYAGPIGDPDQDGWHVRDTRLVADAAGGLSPARVPVSLHIGGASSGEQLALLKNQGDVALGVDLPGFHYDPSGATVQNNSVTLSPDSVASSGVTAVLRATVEGLAASFILVNPSAPSSLSLTLSPDPRAHISAITSGVYQEVRPVTMYGDDGTPIVEQDPEFMVGRATVVDSAVTAATGGRLTTSLSPIGANQSLQIQIDTAWLHSPSRVFPVRVDVPIASMFDVIHTALLGSTVDCDPAGQMLQPNLVVGQTSTCHARGFAKFDLSALGPGVPVLNAALHLWSPNSTAATGISILRNNAPGGLSGLETHAWELPAQQSGGPTVSGAAAIPEAAPNGQWHQWNLTSIVRDWLRDHRTNGGVTLASSSGLTQFATSVGIGLTDPADVAYLDVTLAPYNSDGTYSIYGISGRFGTCSGISCSGNLGVAQASTLTAQYVRVPAVVMCGQSYPTWQDTGKTVPLLPVLQQASSYYLVPVIDFQAVGDGCGNNTTTFQNQVSAFMGQVGSYYPKNKVIYYEIGNEQNLHYDLYGGSASAYQTLFSNVAKIIYQAYSGASNVHILTGGVIQPYDGVYGCTNNQSDQYGALTAAYFNGVSSANLAFAVHPYGYMTGESGYWKNYHIVGAVVTSCTQLDQMISSWLNVWPGIAPVFFTEDNWSSTPSLSAWCQIPTVCEGGYLVDLTTWLWDHNSYGNPNGSTPIRVAWFTGIDFTGTPLGLYNGSANKTIALNIYCPNNGNVAGKNRNMSDDYIYVTYGNCY